MQDPTTTKPDPASSSSQAEPFIPNNHQQEQNSDAGRLALHSAFIAVAVIIILIGPSQFSAKANHKSTSTTTIVSANSTETERSTPIESVSSFLSQKPQTFASLELPTELSNFNYGVFYRESPHLESVPELPKQEITRYAVQTGDTVYGIAQKFGLAPETVLWANQELENNPHWLQLGQEINILPFDGIYHQVGSNDNIANIASTYKTSADKIIAAPINELDPNNPIIRIGQWLAVPDGRKAFVPPTVRSVTNYSLSSVPPEAVAATGIMDWPISGRISQGYYSYHPAIDIESPIGTPVLAIDSGFVVTSGWDNSGYGYHIVIDHGNGLQSLYAHLQTYHVEAGVTVQKGQTIGEIGVTGRSSGPHLHLEVRRGTVQLNPLNFLP